MDKTGSPRILIARMSAMGDTILTMPVACALRREYPNAFIGWVVEKGASPVVLDHDCVDEVIVLKRGWYTSPKAIFGARRVLRPFRFEFTVDCQSTTKSALACWVSGAKKRIGLRGRYGAELSPWLNNHLIEPASPHIVDRSLELLTALDVHQPSVEWRFPIDEATRERMKNAIRHLGLDNGYAVINPGATWDSKLWEMDRYAALAKYLGEVHRLPTLVVWGGQRERLWAREIVESSGGYASLAPPSNLIELAALLEGGRIFVGSDTGPMHMSVAVGTPTIGLHGATRPEDCGAYGKPHLSILVKHHDGTRRERRGASNDCMKLITTKMVCEKCNDLLAATENARRGREAA